MRHIATLLLVVISIAAFGQDAKYKNVRVKNKLTVGGSPNQYTFPTADGTSGHVLTTDGSGNITFQPGGGGGGTGDSSWTSIQVDSIFSFINNRIRVFDTTEFFRLSILDTIQAKTSSNIFLDGNVGVGTGTPLAQLHVDGLSILRTTTSGLATTALVNNTATDGFVQLKVRNDGTHGLDIMSGGSLQTIYNSDYRDRGLIKNSGNNGDVVILTAGAGDVYIGSDDATLSTGLAASSSIFVDGTTNNVGIKNESPTATLDLTGDFVGSGSMAVDGTTFNVDDASNEVGIRTASPSEALHVSGGNALLTGATTGTGVLKLNGTSFPNTHYQVSGVGKAFIGWNNSNTAIEWSANFSSTQMRLNNSGQLGIGVVPTHKLHVATGTGDAFIGGTVEDALLLHRDNGVAGNKVGGLVFQGLDNAGSPLEVGYGRIIAEIVDPVTTSHDGELVFETATAGTLTEKMRIDSAGAWVFQETAITPSNPTDGAEVKQYMKDDKMIFQYNDAGTVRYKYLDLTGIGVTWVHTTVAP